MIAICVIEVITCSIIVKIVLTIYYYQVTGFMLIKERMIIVMEKLFVFACFFVKSGINRAVRIFV